MNNLNFQFTPMRRCCVIYAFISTNIIQYFLERPSMWKIINLPLPTKSRPYSKTFLLCKLHASAVWVRKKKNYMGWGADYFLKNCQVWWVRKQKFFKSGVHYLVSTYAADQSIMCFTFHHATVKFCVISITFR